MRRSVRPLIYGLWMHEAQRSIMVAWTKAYATPRSLEPKGLKPARRKAGSTAQGRAKRRPGYRNGKTG
jgi:hypothetical protein